MRQILRRVFGIQMLDLRHNTYRFQFQRTIFEKGSLSSGGAMFAWILAG